MGAVTSSAAAAAVGRERAFRDVAGQLVLRAANVVLGIVVTVLLVRVLGDEGFGQWSALFAVVTVAGYFGNMGLERVAVERAAAQPERQGDWMGALVTLRLVLALPAALGSLAICLALADDADMRIAAVLVCSLLVTNALMSLRAVFQLQVRNTVTTAIELGNGAVWLAVVVGVLAAGSESIVLIAAGFAAVWALTSVVCTVLAVRAMPVRFRGSQELWRPLVVLGVPVGISSLLTLGYGFVDQVIVFEAAGARDAGLYGAVHRIYERIQFLPATLMTTLFPIIVAARDADPERVRRVVSMAVDYLLMGSLPALTIALAGPEAIVRLLFGAEFAAAAPALPLLMATFVVVSLGYLAGYLIIVYRLQRSFIVFALIALAFNLVANLLLVPTYGFMAAAWVILGTELIVNGLALWAVTRHLGFVPTGRHLGRIVLAAVVAGAIGRLLAEAGAPVVVWTASAGVAYLGLLTALRALDLSELRALRRPASEPVQPGRIG